MLLFIIEIWKWWSENVLNLGSTCQTHQTLLSSSNNRNVGGLLALVNAKWRYFLFRIIFHQFFVKIVAIFLFPFQIKQNLMTFSGCQVRKYSNILLIKRKTKTRMHKKKKFNQPFQNTLTKNVHWICWWAVSRFRFTDESMKIILCLDFWIYKYVITQFRDRDDELKKDTQFTGMNFELWRRLNKIVAQQALPMKNYICIHIVNTRHTYNV